MDKRATKTTREIGHYRCAYGDSVFDIMEQCAHDLGLRKQDVDYSHWSMDVPAGRTIVGTISVRPGDPRSAMHVATERDGEQQ